LSSQQQIYFWREYNENGYLSNWYKSPFVKNGVHFINSEQYFMWGKQQLFDPTNSELENKILTTENSK